MELELLLPGNGDPGVGGPSGVGTKFERTRGIVLPGGGPEAMSATDAARAGGRVPLRGGAAVMRGL